MMMTLSFCRERFFCHIIFCCRIDGPKKTHFPKTSSSSFVFRVLISNTETGKTRNEKKKKNDGVAVLLRSFFFDSNNTISLCVLGSNNNRSVFFLSLSTFAVSREFCFTKHLNIIIIHHQIMAFITKAFYEQAFERNLKAQTTTTTTTRTNNVGVAPTMTHTQRATTTAMFTAHSKKEVVRHT